MVAARRAALVETPASWGSALKRVHIVGNIEFVQPFATNSLSASSTTIDARSERCAFKRYGTPRETS